MASVYNGNLRGSVALAPTTERYVFDVVLTFGIFRTRMLNIILKFKRGGATPVAPSYPPPPLDPPMNVFCMKQSLKEFIRTFVLDFT